MLKRNGPHMPWRCRTRWTTWKSWMPFNSRCMNTKRCIVTIGGSEPIRAFAMMNLAVSRTRAHSATWTCYLSRPKKLPQHSHFSRRKIEAIGRCSKCRIWIWVERGVSWTTTWTWRTPLKRWKMVRHRDQRHRPEMRWHWKRSKDSIGCRSEWLCMVSVRRAITCGSMKCARHWWRWKIALWSASIGRQERVCRITCARQPIHGWWGNSWHFCWKDCKNTKGWIWVGCISLVSVWAHMCPVSLALICRGSDVSQVCCVMITEVVVEFNNWFWLCIR